MIDPSLEDILAAAAADGRLAPTSVANIYQWLTEPRYAPYAEAVAEHVRAGRWQQLDDAFWTVIPFGTGGRRGKLYPIGTNTINDRTMGESAQGLADYVRGQSAGGPLSCAIAYDTRHQSRHFAELCAEIMVANGFQVWFLDGYRSTPELSFAVRHKGCSCGIMITASHNPPSDNAIKAYWSTGGQLLPPHDVGVIDAVMSAGEIHREPFAAALAAGRVVYCQEEVDAAFVAAVLRQSRPGPRDLSILYSPLHGVGTSAVEPVLRGAGFAQFEVFGPHAQPHPDFPNVPNHVSNPERPIVFEAMIEYARGRGFDVAMATDPDCDRLGCVAPLTLAAGAAWAPLTGNQIGSLLTEYLLETAKQAGTLSAKNYVVKTLVTTELIRRVADAYGVRTIGDLLVGFKYIGGVIDEEGPDGFVFGAEESYGFLAGAHARDKDAAVAALLLAELAARAKAEGQSLHEKLAALMFRYGCHVERAFSFTMPGAEGMQRIKQVMAGFRASPPAKLGGLPVAGVRDYREGTTTRPGGGTRPLAGPRGDLVMLDLAEAGNCVAVRPSGTEPLVKFYLFGYQAAGSLADVAARRSLLAQRLETIETELRAFAGDGLA